MTEQEHIFEYQKEGAARDLAVLLMQDYGYSISEALDIVYESETYSKISNPKTGLFFQSSLYLYTFLKDEIETGALK